jgi:hypothetical protein
MRIFVSFGYLPEESWVPELVIPLLEHLGITVIEGREIPGRPIDGEIRRRIASSDALMAFLLRRGKRRSRDAGYETSDYVRQEIEIALGQEKECIQVVEKGVRQVAGFARQLQMLSYERKGRDELLAALVRHLRIWCAGEVKVRLGPQSLVEAIESEVYARKAFCRYTIVHDSREEREGVAQIFAEGGGLFAKVLGFQPGTQAQISVSAGGVQWTSPLIAHSQPFSQIDLTVHP